jgi:hypothetical protein
MLGGSIFVFIVDLRQAQQLITDKTCDMGQRRNKEQEADKSIFLQLDEKRSYSILDSQEQ